MLQTHECRITNLTMANMKILFKKSFTQRKHFFKQCFIMLTQFKKECLLCYIFAWQHSLFSFVGYLYILNIYNAGCVKHTHTCPQVQCLKLIYRKCF